MDSDLECGVCYRLYNGGARCPRELSCGHSFCERCLRALCHPAAAADDASSPACRIDCPLCRRATSVSQLDNIKKELRLNEDTFERMLAAGVLSEEEEEEELQKGSEEEAALTESQAEESDSSPASPRGSFRRSFRRLWKMLTGNSSEQRDCVTSDDMRCLAMMANYMF
ncbi:RING finger protein 227 isoform X2 [Thalassophryne amazonica]|uniref:RING finger protein 227 isoform X2 n=1 Tax=Thalassophryne amazonica TaxID=390379 RepID=UPI00147131A5|nr:RING finger protein 227 isoform X2 [Thalassophryne amazonica]